MNEKASYSFKQMQEYYSKLLKEREDIVNNLGLPIKRDGDILNSLIEDLKNVTIKINELEGMTVWTDRLK